MSFIERSVEFILSHNESVIQWLIVAIVGLVALLIARSLFKKEKTSVSSSAIVGGGASVEQIEEVLSKILEKTKVWDEKAASPSAAGAVPSADLDSAKKELAELKQALKNKESELKLLKSETPGGAVATASPSNDSTAKLLSRIEELESRLAEYEILEDDIADLSLYKEENSRLKGELERLRGASGAPSNVSGVEAPEPKAPDDLVKEFAEAVGKDAKEAEAATEPVVAESAMDTVVNPIESMTASVSPQGEVDDLFAELASKDLDTDRVVSELAALQSLESTTSAEDALGGDLDPDKILAESGEMKS